MRRYRSSIRLWIVVVFLTALLLTPLTAATEPYIPLTPAEAMAWWDAITPEQRAEFIIRYDAVEHATPVLDAPRYVAVVAGRDLHLLSPQPAALAIGELRYQVTYAPLNYIDLLPAPKDRSCEVTFWKITTLAAFLLGSGMGWLVHP